MERIDLHNPSTDERLARAGLCGRVHLASGRTCVRPHHHAGACQFVECPADLEPPRRGGRAGVADCLIVGGGPAGLSAALTLARLDRRITLVDGGRGRSTHHQVNRNYLGFPDGVTARELRRLGRRQLSRYRTVALRSGRVDALMREPGGDFVATARWGTVRAATVILATGVLDHFPRFRGWESCVGRSMFWCIACDGYEARGRRLVVAGDTNQAALEALQLRRLAAEVTMLSNSSTPTVDAAMRDRLREAGVAFVDDCIAGAKVRRGRIVRLLTHGGRAFSPDALFVVQGATPQARLATDVGAALTPQGFVRVDVEQQTEIPGLYAAGDVTHLHSHQVSTAAHEGAAAATAANYYLYPEELK